MNSRREHCRQWQVEGARATKNVEEESHLLIRKTLRVPLRPSREDAETFPKNKNKNKPTPTNAMKLKNCILAALCAVAALSQTSRAALQAALPEFKSKQALQAQAASRQVNKEEASGNVFYTGKPFEAEREGYLFKYRSYDSELNRWTSVDPSGFPDGANNQCYCSVPTNSFDIGGTFDWRQFDISKFDSQGLEQLGHWLEGSGTTVSTTDGAWGDYMKANISLHGQILGHLYQDLDSRSGSGSLDITFHAEMEQNNYYSGYGQLHGTDSTVGDFHIGGNVNITQNGGVKMGDYSVTLTWNDIINPNLTYQMDEWLSDAAHWLFSPADYTVQYSWNDHFLLE